jgi:hypothetical protein
MFIAIVRRLFCFLRSYSAATIKLTNTPVSLILVPQLCINRATKKVYEEGLFQKAKAQHSASTADWPFQCATKRSGSFQKEKRSALQQIPGSEAYAGSQARKQWTTAILFPRPSYQDCISLHHQLDYIIIQKCTSHSGNFGKQHI